MTPRLPISSRQAAALLRAAQKERGIIQLIGIAIGLALAGAASLALSIPFAPSLAVVLLAVGFSALIGMVFGFFPALRGARLDPIDALRHE